MLLLLLLLSLSSQVESLRHHHGHHCPTMVSTRSSSVAFVVTPTRRQRAAGIPSSSSSSSFSGRKRRAVVLQNGDENGGSQNDATAKSPNQSKPRKPPSSLSRPRIPILQYHPRWVAVNKPAQMPVHRNIHPNGRQQRQRQRRRPEPNVASLLKQQLSRKVWPVHRLDHRTSGALLFAFDAEACAMLHQALTSGGTSEDEEEEDDDDFMDDTPTADPCTNSATAAARKEYIALLRGDWRHIQQKFAATTPAKDDTYMLFVEDATLLVTKPLEVKGILKEAQTEFQFLAALDRWPIMRMDNNNTTPLLPPQDNNNDVTAYHGACSLVICRPKTGRTHQIRRHAYAMGQPILGDTQHGDSKVNRWWRTHGKVPLDRLFLHCLSLDLSLASSQDDDGSSSLLEDKDHKENDSNLLDQPQPQQRLQVVAPLPLELAHVLRQPALQQLWQEAVAKEPRLAWEPIDEIGGSHGRGYRQQRRQQEEQPEK